MNSYRPMPVLCSSYSLLEIKKATKTDKQMLVGKSKVNLVPAEAHAQLRDNALA